MTLTNLSKIGASLSGGANTILVEQDSHGLTLGQIVRSSGTNGAFRTAQADTAENAEVVGIVTDYIDADSFVMTISGRITVNDIVPNVTAGTVLFLSHSSAGALTVTEPSGAGQISKPVAVVTIADSEMIMVNYRGEVITTATESWDVNGAELILDVDGDTTIRANTDDQIDIKISDAVDFNFTANTLNVLSGSTLSINSGATLSNSGTLVGFNSNSFTVTQSSHGLAVGNVVKSSGSNGAFAKARANSAANAEVIGVVTVVSGNDVTITTSGEVDVAAAVPDVTAGTVVFLHQDGGSDEGTLTDTEPTTEGQISKPIAIVTHQNSKMVLLPFRGEIVSTGVQSIADGSITLAKIAHTNNGNDGLFLRHNGSNSDPTWAAPASGLNFIATDVASNDSTLEVTLTGSYETYLITGSDLKPSNDSQSLYAQVGTSSAWTTGYANAFHRIKSDATHDMSASNSQSFILLAPTVGNSTGEGCGFAIWIVQPRGVSDVYPVIHGTMTAINASTIVEAGVVASMATSAVDLQRFKIYMSAGNLTSGRLTVWGLSHA